ncbi:phosphate acetyltransferase [Buchnera aphidicola (Mindarus keteleerifoliae)]|uniref:phosphate acetyltransferase n=1 Tax=Buchnera aphidicola TaxID=9 RepID=UPI0031B68F18
MSKVIMLIPIEKNVGLTTISLGVISAIQKKTSNIGFFKPIINSNNLEKMDHTSQILSTNFSIFIIKSIHIKIDDVIYKKKFFSNLIERIIDRYESYKNKTEITLIEGFSIKNNPIWNKLNFKIAKILNARIILVTIFKKLSNLNKFKKKEVDFYFKKNLDGVIVNKKNEPNFLKNIDNVSEFDFFYQKKLFLKYQFIKKIKFLPIIAAIPWTMKLLETPILKITNYLNAFSFCKRKKTKNFLVNKIKIFNQDYKNMKEEDISNSLIIVNSNFLKKIKFYINFFEKKNINFSILVVFGNMEKKSLYLSLSKINISIFFIYLDFYEVLFLLKKFSFKFFADEGTRIKRIARYVQSFINKKWTNNIIKKKENNHFLVNPEMFKYKLKKNAILLNKTILLPEGNDPRIIESANICSKLRIANCILLGNKNEIKKIASIKKISLNKNIKILEPKVIQENYKNDLIEIYSKKGIERKIAEKDIKKNIILAMLLLLNNKVDGVVAGVINTTSEVIRSALRIVGMSREVKLISSIFFMLLEEKILIYSDCAINPNPSSDQLADIAIQTFNSSKLFGIDPKIAMLSYSTGFSGGKNSSIEKVVLAKEILNKKRPDILVEGPIQYDAAIDSEISRLKLPKSILKGKATILIFPDLNSGNIAYKAVQNSTKSTCIGPILQGIKKPINDLSRGSTVIDIVYTIATTVIQTNDKII